MLSERTRLRHEHGYEIQRLLSEKGGMGVVYQATDLNMRSTVVIKHSRFNDKDFLRRIFPNLSPQQISEQADMLRNAFEREARLLFGLRHSALPRALNYFMTERGDQFLVMEFIDGKDLSELLDERVRDALGPFPLGQVLDWADQILDVLHYLHTEFAQPIIHRDIKPQNLKRVPNGRLVLLDFGLAKGAHPDMSSVAKSVPGHTWPYSSLEQIGGKGTDERSDLYSLACTLYHLLTGAAPLNAVLRVNEKLDPLRPACEANPRVPVTISEVLHRAAALWPDDRYGSAAEMRTALREAAMASEESVVTQPAAGPFSGDVIARTPPEVQTVVQESFTEELGNGVRLKMVGLAGGSFVMGAAEGKGFEAEQPRHLVTLSPFFVGRYQATQAEWREVMGSNPSSFKNDDSPVERVSWDEAVRFCELLSLRTGKPYRLLTEAEWEYACRADSAGEFCFGDDAGLLDQYAWYTRNSERRTHSVGLKQSNAWGLYDMHGNVWEWCGDWHDEDYYGRSEESNPQGPEAGKARVLRGGSWSDDSYCCGAAYRNSGTAIHRSDSVGFRVGLSAAG